MAEIDIVRRWQRSLVDADEAPALEEPLSVAKVYEYCSSFFCDVLTALSHNPSTEPSVVLSLQRAQSYLVLWADGLDIRDGMLDTALKKSKRARATTLRLLFSVSRTLTHRLLSHVTNDHESQLASRASELARMTAQVKGASCQDRKPVFHSDTDSDTSSEGGDMRLSEIAEDLRTDTQCLLDLASRFQEPAIGPVSDEPVVDLGDLNSWNPAQNFINRIRQRYPQCDARLAERLGNASWSRVRHCQELKTENSKLRQQAAAIPTKKSSSKAASTLFQDSGLGSSVPSGLSVPAPSEYAETVVSYDGGQGGSVRVPPLPEGAREGTPFECVGCGTMVVARGKRAWKKHLFQDLQPYLCLEDACPQNETPFATNQEWKNHMSLEHGDAALPESADCRICSETLTGSMLQTAAHLARHLEEIALTVLPTSPESEEGMDNDSRLSSTDGSQREDLAEPSVEAEQEMKTLPNEDIKSLLERLIILPLRREAKFQRLAFPTVASDWTLRMLEKSLLAAATHRPVKEYSDIGLQVIDKIESSLQVIPEHAHASEGEQPYTKEYFSRIRTDLRKQSEDKVEHPFMRHPFRAPESIHQLNPGPTHQPTTIEKTFSDRFNAVESSMNPEKPLLNRSCLNCRMRRIPCDLHQPGCFQCAKRNSMCSYRHPSSEKKVEPVASPSIPRMSKDRKLSGFITEDEKNILAALAGTLEQAERPSPPISSTPQSSLPQYYAAQHSEGTPEANSVPVPPQVDTFGLSVLADIAENPDMYRNQPETISSAGAKPGYGFYRGKHPEGLHSTKVDRNSGTMEYWSGDPGFKFEASPFGGFDPEGKAEAASRNMQEELRGLGSWPESSLHHESITVQDSFEGQKPQEETTYIGETQSHTDLFSNVASRP